MRISADIGDPDDWRVHFKPGVKVYLNGQEISCAVEADDGAGYVIAVETDAAGNAVVAPCGKKLLMRKITGRVDIVGERLE